MLEKRWSSYQAHKTPRDSDTSSEVSLASTNTDTMTLKNQPIRYRMDKGKEVLNNIPVFDGKQGKLNQFFSTIKSCSTMYRVHKVHLMMLPLRGKAHKIISHAVSEDPDVEWLDIKRKLTNNYGATRSSIEAGVKITKLSMSSEETVGKYLAQARTLIKTKLKNPMQCNSEFNETYMYHVCNGIIKQGLKA